MQKGKPMFCLFHSPDYDFDLDFVKKTRNYSVH